MALNKTKMTLAILIGVLFLAFLGVRAHNAYQFHLRKQTRFMMDTYVTIQAIGSEKMTAKAIDKAFERMQEIDEKFNHLNPESPLYAFNYQGVPISDREVLDVVHVALDVAQKSDGAFDITILPLADLWGFYGEGPPHLPQKQEIKDCLQDIGYKGLKIENNSLAKTKESIKIDLGGIAKGYAISQSVKVLRAEGITSALIDAGGDVYALGKKGNGFWKIGIRNPHGEDLLGSLEVEDLAVMGSGDYERFFEEDGKRYHHIFNSKTGFPAEGLSGITLVHPDPLIADAWNTALFVLGPERALKVAEGMPSMETIVVTTAGEVSISSGLKNKLKAISKNN